MSEGCSAAESDNGKIKGEVKRPFMGNTEGQFSLEFVVKFIIKIARLTDVEYQKNYQISVGKSDVRKWFQ